MGIFDRFPYSSTHEMNLDFMLGKATEIAEDMQTVTAGMAQVQAGLSAISEKTEQATQAAAQAAASASSIEGSVTAAEEAAEEAQMHNESAQTWANNALTYKADCQRAATEAAASSSSAAQAATAAAASEDTVATYAQAANASAQSAANNNDSAHQYANQASASASNATFHSSNAQTAATNAQTAATNANTSATNASASADRAASLKTDVETLHRMCTAAVDQAATEAVNAANSAAQAAATKTDVETLVESLPEDFTDLNNTVNQLSDDVDNINKNRYESFSGSGFWEQGYWAIATGTASGSNNWIRTKGYITDYDFVHAPSNYLMYLMAYDGNTYIGAWNGNAFSKTYAAGSGLPYIDIENFREKYPTYTYKISLILSDSSAITPAAAGPNIIFGTWVNIVHFANVTTALQSNVRVINHRGYNIIAPENTMPAFILSAKYGFKYVETDVLFTAPDANNPIGVPVLLHDATINRTARNADGTTISSTINIADITYEQALAYDFGIWKSQEYTGTKIPTFEQFIKLCKCYGLHPYIELKFEKTYSQDEIDLILSIIVNNGMRDNVSFISYDATALQLVKNRWDWVELGCNMNVGIDACIALRSDHNSVFVLYEKDRQASSFADAGFPTCPYTINSANDFTIIDSHYSMILTDGLKPVQAQHYMIENL